MPRAATGWWRLLAEAAREPGRREHALRATACLTLPLLAGILAGDVPAGLFASLGGFAGFSAQQEPYRRRARIVATLAVAYPLAVVLGTLAAPSGLAASLVPGAVAAVTAFVALAFALPPPREYLIIMTCLLVTGLPAGPGEALHRGALTLAGASFAFLVAMSTWWRHPDRPQRRALAGSARATAALLDALPDPPGSAVHAAILATRSARTTLSATGASGEPLLPVLRSLEALCASAIGLANVRAAAAPGQAQRLRAWAACHAGAGADPRPPVPARPPQAPDEGDDPVAVGHRARVEQHLRDLEHPVAAAAGAERSALPGVRARLTAAADRSSLIVPLAVRMGVAVAAGAGLGHALELSHPYWAGLTAAAVLLGGTGPLQRRRARDRALGTAGGVVLAAALLAAGPPVGVMLVMLVAVMLVGELLIASSYAIAVIFITPIPLLMMRMAGDPTSAMGARLLDTLIGCVLGVVLAAIVWPHAARIRLPAAARRSFDTSAACLRAMIDPATTPAAAAESRNRALAELVTLRTVLDSALGERLQAAPEADRAAPLAGSVERFGRLVTGIIHGEHLLPEGDQRREVDRTLRRISASLFEEDGGPPERVPPLPGLPRTQAELERLAEAIRAR